MLHRLEAGAATCACGERLAALSTLHRSDLCTALVFDRLGRKMRLVEELHAACDRNWNRTFYGLYFRTLGDRQNQEAYLELARRVPYRVVLRERLTPHAVEAMLFGASGLLDLYPHDSYTLDLGRTFVHLASKHDIRPMEASAWELAGIRPANHPVLRLAEAAEFFARDEFVVDRAMACRSEADIRRLFCTEASAYWRTHHIPGSPADESPSASAPSRPTSSASTWSPCCNMPTAATRGATRCATTPWRCSSGCPPSRTATCAPGARRAARSRATPSSRRRCCSWPPNIAPRAAAPRAPRAPHPAAGEQLAAAE